MEHSCDFLIIGSGVAASSCADELLALASPKNTVTMLAPRCDDVRVASSSLRISRILEEISISSFHKNDLFVNNQNFSFFQGFASKIDHTKKIVVTECKQSLRYNKLILCTGSIPKQFFKHPLIKTLKDIQSIQEFRNILSTSRSLCIVGNGGIAMELAYETVNCRVHWIIRQDYAGSRFFDSQTSNFFLSHKNSKYQLRKNQLNLFDSSIDNHCTTTGTTHLGGGVGPDWSKDFALVGGDTTCPPYPYNIFLYFNSEVSSVIDGPNSNLKVTTNLGETIFCDFMISAIGVEPNTSIAKTTNGAIALNEYGAIIVDKMMQTSVNDIFAAGDCCSILPPESSTTHPFLWFQMPLWSQAKCMGCHVARCVLNPEEPFPIQLELFGHFTRFFGFKVCLLGLYNGQGFKDTELIYRTRLDHRSFVRIVIMNGKIIGAVLIGDTDLEETFENLILSRLDISHIIDEILNPNIDIADYFD